MLLLKGTFEIWGPDFEMIFPRSTITYLCWKSDDIAYFIDGKVYLGSYMSCGWLCLAYMYMTLNVSILL